MSGKSPDNKKPDNGLWYRTEAMDRETVNIDTRSVDLSFSSESPVMRYFGKEILWHDPSSVDLSRLQNMGSVLLNHNPSVIVGRPDNIRLDQRKGRAQIIFDKDQTGDMALAKVQSGSLRGVSVGYVVNKFREVKEGETWRGIEGPAYVATSWQPVEISLTPVPADHSVGVGRSIEGIEIEKSNMEGGHEMTQEELKAIIVEEQNRFKTEIQTMLDAEKQQREQEGKPRIRVTPEEYVDLLGRSAAISPDAVVKFSGWVAEGKSGPEIQRSLLDLATSKPDARNAGSSSGDGTGMPEGKPNEPAKPKSWKEVDDESFVRGLTNPSMAM
jgi:phage head maturation protease